MAMVNALAVRASSDGRPHVTADNIAPILQVLAWLLLSALSMGFLVRIMSRRYLLHNSGIDDALVALSFIFALGQSLCVVIPKDPIWGQRMSLISRDAMILGLKAQYAANLFFFLSLAFAKASVLLTIAKLLPVQQHAAVFIGMGAAIVTWIVATEFALALQCSPPTPWLVGKSCLNRSAIFLFANIVSILIDAALSLYPVCIIMPLRMPLALRIHSVLLLSARFLVVVAAIVQVSYLRIALEGDFAFNSFGYYFAMQVVQTLSILTACLPFFNIFMKSLQSRGVFIRDRVSADHYIAATNAGDAYWKGSATSWMENGRYVRLKTMGSQTTHSRGRPVAH